jgi:hypothetical protein
MVSSSACFTEAHGPGRFRDRACCHGGLISRLPALISLESSAVHKAMVRPFAARATKAVGPADLEWHGVPWPEWNLCTPVRRP